MAIIGTAYVQVRAEDKHFEADVRAAARKIKNVNIQLKADVDMSKASKKIRDLRYRITSKDAVLKVDADVTKADAKMAKLLSKFLSNDLEFNAVANTGEANTELSRLRDRFSRNRANFTADADTTKAKAQLDWAARHRTASISARLDPTTSAALKGMFNTLTGTIPYEKIRAVLSGIAANFEGLAVKGTALVSVLGAISAEVLVAGANILSVGGDISQAIGIVALFPAALGGMISIMAATKMAWSNFGKAFNKDAKKSAEAMSKLPTEAQNTVKALKGVYEQIQKPVQKAFWVSMGTSLQDTVKRLLPALKDGFVKVGGSLGRVTKEVSLAFGRLGDGTLQKMFEHLAKFLDNITPGMGRLIDAFNILGKVGATYLPQFGTYLTGLATQFKAFISNAEKTGKINEWIETGTQRLQEMGSIVKSTAGIFSGLTKAARVAGAPGLTEMAASLRNIRDTVQGEPFQSQLVTILEGARTGAEQVGKGFKTLTGLIGKSSGAIGLFLGQAGKVAGLTFESITSLFDGTGLGAGLFSAMIGLEDALKELQPGFADLGSSIGSLGEIAGAVIREMAPGLNQLFDTVDKILASIKQGVLDALPVFNQFIQAVLAVAQGPIVALTTQIGNMLTAFSELPGGIQTVMMSLGLFLLLKGRFAGFFSGIGKSLRDETTTAGRSFGQISNGAKMMQRTVKTEFTSLGRVMSGTLFEVSDGIKKNFKVAVDSIPASTRSMFSRVSGDLRQAGAQLVTSMSLKPWLGSVDDGFRNLKTSVTQSFSGISTAVTGAFSNLGRAIVPVGSAVDRVGGRVRDMASQMHGNLAPARTAFSMLGTHVRDVSRNMASGLVSGAKMAAGGLGAALGGPWGIAIAGATMLLGDYAQKAADTRAKVDELAGALDQVSGASTESSRLIVANNLNVNRSFAGIKMDSAFDIAKQLGISLEDVTAAASGVPGKFQEINKSLEASGEGASKFGTGLKIVADAGLVISPFANWIKDTGLFQTKGDKLNDMISEQIKLDEEAKQKIQNLAEATGKTTIEAGALARNYQILADATSSADAKFEAIKSNLEINGGQLHTASNNLRDYNEKMLDLTDNLKGIGTKYDGWTKGQTKLSEGFKKNIIDQNGMFVSSTRGSIAFSKEMDSAKDAILKKGAAEMKRLQDMGVAAPEAATKALAVMDQGTKDLRAKLKGVGIEGALANQIIGALKLNPDDLKGAISIDTKDAENAILRLDILKSAIATGNWEVALSASDDKVKETILGTDILKKAYETDGWEAVVGLIDKSKIPMSEFMLRISQAKDKSEIQAIIKAAFPDAKVLDGAQKQIDTLNRTPVAIKELKATDNVTTPATNATKGLEGYNAFAVLTKGLNATNNTAGPTKAAQSTMDTLTSVTRGLFGENKTKPAVDLASGTIRGLNGKTVDLKANDWVTPVAKQAKQSIDNVTGKSVDIISRFRSLYMPPEGKYSGPMARPTSGPGSMFGSLIPSVTNTASLFKGQFPMKYFANGGVENHVAQIAKGATPYRVWAEPETGGEAYIPLSKAKRPRSLKILEEVAKMFGMSLIKVKGFANGGTVGGKSGQSSSASLPTSGNVPAALLRSITQSLLKDNNGLNNIGQNIVDGIIGGVNNKRGAAVTAMKVLSNDLENTVRTELDIHSPSKAFLALGKYIVDGLSVGIKSNAGTAIKNMATLSNRIYIAASDVAKATGRSVSSSLTLINHQKTLNRAWSKMPSWKYTDQIVDYYQKTGRTGNRTLADIVRARDDISSRLNAANARLKTQTTAYGEVVKDVESKMKGEFKLGSNILTDTQPYVPEMKFSDVKTYTTGVLGRLRTFNSKLQALRKKGVAPALINEVAQLGSAEGIAMADALLSGSSAEVRGLNSDVAAISGISHSIGVSTADGMYKAGIDATRGLVNGLTKDKNSLTSAANQISSTLIRQVKNNLGIRSPSRVFAELGRYTTEGYIVGLDQMQPKLNNRVDSLINVTPRRTTLSMKNISTTTTAPAGVSALSTPSAAPAVIQVLPSAGMDEVAVGQAAVRELNWQMLSR